MISPDWCRMMAAYNSEMNRRLYGVADGLDASTRQADGGAFWGSIQGTLCHLLWGDTTWMSRFDAWEKPSVGMQQSPVMLWAAAMNMECSFSRQELEALPALSRAIAAAHLLPAAIGWDDITPEHHAEA